MKVCLKREKGTPSYAKDFFCAGESNLFFFISVLSSVYGLRLFSGLGSLCEKTGHKKRESSFCAQKSLQSLPLVFPICDYWDWIKFRVFYKTLKWHVWLSFFLLWQEEHENREPCGVYVTSTQKQAEKIVHYHEKFLLRSASNTVV